MFLTLLGRQTLKEMVTEMSFSESNNMSKKRSYQPVT